MIELDLTYFSGRNACDCVKRDIDHRNTLLGLPHFSEELASRYVGVSSSVFSFATYLVSRLRDAALPR